MRVVLTLGVTVLATVAATSPARADTSANASGGVDWSRIVAEIDALARRGATVLDSPRCGPAGCMTDTNATAAATDRGVRFDEPGSTKDWFGFKPSVSLVARDWGASFRVAGDRLAVVDVLRLTSSTRMVLTRVRLSDSRVAPFVQAGLGQWRTDPYLLPLSPHYQECAAQVAAGVEVRVRGSWVIGLEQTGTVLHREQGSRNLPSAHMWSSTLASRFDF